MKFPLPPKELHPNSRVSWQAKSRARDGTKKKPGYRWAVYIEAKKQMPIDWWVPTGQVRATLTFVYPTNRKRDGDNLLAWCKTLFDALVDARVLAADDSNALHHAPVEIVVDRTLKTPEIRVRLEGAPRNAHQA